MESLEVSLLRSETEKLEKLEVFHFCFRCMTKVFKPQECLISCSTYDVIDNVNYKVFLNLRTMENSEFHTDPDLTFEVL